MVVKDKDAKIKEMQAIAKTRDGKCLSKKYVNASTKLEWECSKGHRWSSKPSHIKSSGSWCPDCGGNKQLTIEEMQAIAKSRGGKCLSNEYINQNAKLEWECGKGHRWMADPNHIKNRESWCPKCAGNKKRTIEEMQAIAKSRGGKCLSSKYVNSHTKLEWECSNGHQWSSSPTSIAHIPTWCPECASGISERICRAYFEQHFGKRFPNSRPDWLINSQGNKMELDGYCQDLSIAFEHQGEQHYTQRGHWQSTDKLFALQKSRDKEKASLCKKNKVRLFIIPQLFTRTKIDNLTKLIYDECLRLKVRRPKGFLAKKINLKVAWQANGMEEEIKCLNSIAKSRGGKLISTFYINNKTNLEWECSEGHRWMATPSTIKNQGNWCHECGGSKQLTIEEMRIIAKSRGGKCLSNEYINLNAKLEWECGKGHRWMAASSNIKYHDAWCPDCGGNKQLTIEEMQAIAKSRGGKCLSNEYINQNAKLEWECGKGHRWMADPNHIKNRESWCPDCGGTKQLTIEEMRTIAKSRGGKCLSNKYVNAHAALLWECKKGHQWKAKPMSIKAGNWCLECSGNAKNTIEEMQAIAKTRDGKCLSKKYVNASTKLEWECSKGHRWSSKPSHIKSSGSWCPECGGSKQLTIEEMRTIAKSHGGKCLSNKYVNAFTKLEWECSKGHRWMATPNHIKNRGTWCPQCWKKS